MKNNSSNYSNSNTILVLIFDIDLNLFYAEKNVITKIKFYGIGKSI